MNIQAILWIEISLLMLGLMFLWGQYRDLRVDILRQKLFSARDELFAKAEQGELRFDAEAYRMVRLTLNGMIRFAHELGFLRFIVSLYTVRSLKHLGDDTYEKTMISALSKVESERGRVLLVDALRDMHEAVLKHIMLTSPICLCVLFVVVIALVLKRALGRSQEAAEIKAAGVKEVRKLDAEAYNIGLSVASSTRKISMAAVS